MIAQEKSNTDSIRITAKADKVYLNNSKLIYRLAEHTGNIHRLFFFNQMRVKYDVFTSTVPYFMIGDKDFVMGDKSKR